jgi:flagellar biosynthesis chaperone FliJ
MSAKSRLLELAVRAREWALLNEGSVLQEADARLSASLAIRQEAESTKQRAQEGRSTLLSRPAFHPGDLLRHAAYIADVEHQVASAQAAVDHDEANVAECRRKLQATFRERDAYLACLSEHLARRVHADKVVEARIAEELWASARSESEK